MHAKLAGHVPLQEMIEQVIDSARSKTAAVDKKTSPTVKTASAEKVAASSEKKAIIDFSNPEEVEKLASALDLASEKLASDHVFLGGESRQGGEVLPTAGVVGGKQPYKKDSSKGHNVPMSTGLETKKDNPGAKTMVPDNEGKAPGGAPMPKKGVMKTAADTVLDRIRAAKEKGGKPEEKKEEKAKESMACICKDGKTDPNCKVCKEKQSAPLDYLLGKIAESTQGGETLDSPSGSGPKPPSDAKGGNDARSALESSKAAIDLKKVTAKAPQKRQLSEVLTEPALSKAHDSKVQENLRNASKGGVKIAAATAFLSKIASDPTDPRHAALKDAIEKKKAEKEEKDLKSTDTPIADAAGTSPSTPTA